MVVLTAVPPGLRGHLTRWLIEVAPGVFVGRITARVGDHLWATVCRHAGEAGQGLMIHAARNEQGLSFRVVGSSWQPVDADGVMLIRRSLTK